MRENIYEKFHSIAVPAIGLLSPAFNGLKDP